MKYIRIILKVIEWLLPGNAGKGRIADDLELAKATIMILTKKLPAAEKGKIIEDAILNLSAVKGFKKRAAKKLDKAKSRIWSKIFN